MLVEKLVSPVLTVTSVKAEPKKCQYVKMVNLSPSPLLTVIQVLLTQTLSVNLVQMANFVRLVRKSLNFATAAVSALVVFLTPAPSEPITIRLEVNLKMLAILVNPDFSAQSKK